MQKKSETSVNPITKQHNESYWTITTGYFETLNCDLVTQILINKVKDKIPIIKKIAQENHGGITIYIVVIIENGNTPSICISTDLMKIALELNTTIDFDMYVN